MATIPVFMALSEILLLRTRKATTTFGTRAVECLAIGGVSVLMSRSLNLGGAPIDTRGAITLSLIIASMNWSLGSALMRKLPLPSCQMSHEYRVRRCSPGACC